MRAQPTVVRETPVSTLIDGGSGLGQRLMPRRAHGVAIAKAKATGIGVCAVRKLGHSAPGLLRP